MPQCLVIPDGQPQTLQGFQAEVWYRKGSLVIVKGILEAKKQKNSTKIIQVYI